MDCNQFAERLADLAEELPAGLTHENDDWDADLARVLRALTRVGKALTAAAVRIGDAAGEMEADRWDDVSEEMATVVAPYGEIMTDGLASAATLAAEEQAETAAVLAEATRAYDAAIAGPGD